MSLSVVLCATGRVGTAAGRAIIRHPGLRLVGCLAYGAEKRGQDVGVLCGLEPVGIRATGALAELLTVKADCFVYVPRFPRLQEMLAIVSSGSNLVTTSHFVNGQQYLKDNGALHAAAKAAGVSVLGTGVYPGLVHAIALGLTAQSQWVRKLRVQVSKDLTYTALPEQHRKQGLGVSPDTPGLTEAGLRAMAYRGEVVGMLAAGLGVELDDIRGEIEYAIATETIDLGFTLVKKGHTAGLRNRWQGIVDGEVVVENESLFTIGNKLEPAWTVSNGYAIEVLGYPSVRSEIRQEFAGGLAKGFDPGTITAMPAVHAIRAVCEAPPGLIYPHQLPLITAMNAAGPRATWAMPTEQQLRNPRLIWGSTGEAEWSRTGN